MPSKQVITIETAAISNSPTARCRTHATTHRGSHAVASSTMQCAGRGAQQELQHPRTRRPRGNHCGWIRSKLRAMLSAGDCRNACCSIATHLRPINTYLHRHTKVCARYRVNIRTTTTTHVLSATGSGSHKVAGVYLVRCRLAAAAA